MGIGTDLDPAAHMVGGLGSPNCGGTKGFDNKGLYSWASLSSLPVCVAPSLWPLSVNDGVSRIFGFPLRSGERESNSTRLSSIEWVFMT